MMEGFSPFEVKNMLRQLAHNNHAHAPDGQFLDAGRGNPNWVAAGAPPVYEVPSSCPPLYGTVQPKLGSCEPCCSWPARAHS